MKGEKEAVQRMLQEKGYEEAVLVGEGAFARVYRVYDKERKRYYACKISREQEMLRREGVLMRQLSHPLFPAYETCWRDGEWSFLVMEYLSGVSLAKILATQGRLAEGQALQIVMRLAEGLCYLHELPEPVIFRDVKPENIIIGEKGRVTLLDLGSAGSMDSALHVITGTPGYGAPEQWSKQEKVGAHSDVYALGQVLLEMLSGLKPVVAGAAGSHIEELFAREKQVHFGVIRLIEECTREAVAERIPGMRCVIQRLKPYVEKEKNAIRRAERHARLFCKKPSEYIYQQNILKIGTDNLIITGN